MSETRTPSDLRRLIVRGTTNDGGHDLMATIYEPAEHIPTVTAYFLANGMTVENPEPDTHAVPPVGEQYDVQLNPIYVAHAAALASAGVNDIAAHVDSLIQQKAGA